MSLSRQIPLEGLQNIRDLGGMETRDGRRIREGKLIRSEALYPATESDRRELAGRIRLIVDFRTEREREEKPNPRLPGAEDLHVAILEQLVSGVTREKNAEKRILEELNWDPERAGLYMTGIYEGFVDSAFSRAGYERFLRLLLEEREGAVLWHCSVGKDRTGFAAVLIQELLGVEREVIREDYLATGRYLAARTEALQEKIGAQLGTMNERISRTLSNLFSVRADYLEAVYRAADRRFGGMEGLLRDGLHMGEAERERLRALYLEPLP